MAEQQKTINQECALSCVGLHTGKTVNSSFKPAGENEGIAFKRVDLPQKPLIKAVTSNVSNNSSIPRCTSVSQGNVTIHTVEHLMSVCCGLGIDNLLVEIDGHELRVPKLI